MSIEIDPTWRDAVEHGITKMTCSECGNVTSKGRPGAIGELETLLDLHCMLTDGAPVLPGRLPEIIAGALRQWDATQPISDGSPGAAA